MSLRWIIYYDDGSSFTSEGGEDAAPRAGVQAVATKHDSCGRLIWHSSDFYCWQDGEWVPRSLIGLMDYLNQPGREKIVLQGRGIGYTRFLEIYHAAVNDRRLPAKSARHPIEPEVPGI